MTAIERDLRKQNAKEYRAGTLAYIDSFGGMIECRIVEVRKPCYGFTLGNFDDLLVEITEDKGGYRKGERVEKPAFHCLPRSHRVLRGYHYRINAEYKYATT